MTVRFLGRFVGAFVIVAAAYGLLQYFDRIDELVIVPGMIVMVALVRWLMPADYEPDQRTVYTVAGTIVAAAIGIFFRTHYLWVVPIGYKFEPLGFVFFAARLVAEHFPYIPYAWYAHTLYSYFIAVAALVSPSELTAFRAVSAAISFSTLGALYLFLRRFVGGRAAWIGMALLGASYWHNWASRNGYHQQLLPLFQLLFLYGVLDAIARRRIRGSIVAAVAMVLGLHSHWGFYLMPVVWLLLLFHLFLFDRVRFRETRRLMLGTIALCVALAVPLLIFLFYNSNVFGYVFRGFSVDMSGTTDFATKMSKNWRLVLWWLSGHAKSKAEYGPAVDFIVGTAACVGLAVSLRNFRKSLPHAALVYLLAINVLGLTLTLAYYFYVIATMAAVYALAAVGIVAVSRHLEELNPRRVAPLIFVATLALVAWQAKINYDAFFKARIFTDLTTPSKPPGGLLMLLDELKGLVKTHVVYVPRDEPGRDFDLQVFELGRRVPTYAFILDTLPYEAATVLFPEKEVGAAQGVEILQPNNEFVQRVVLPMYRRLYPHLVVHEVVAPEPYFTRDPAPIAVRMSVPRADVVAYHGLQASVGDDGSFVQAGLLHVARDARVHFRTFAAAPLRVRVHEQEVVLTPGEAGPQDGSPLLLEGGLHPIRIESALPWSAFDVEWRQEKSGWEAISSSLLNSGDVEPGLLEPYLAALGTQSSYYYNERLRVRTGVDTLDAVVNPDGSTVGVDARALTEYDSAGAKLRTQALPGPNTFHFQEMRAQRLLSDPGGRLYALDGALLSKRPVPKCDLVDITARANDLVRLCRNGDVLDENGRSLTPQPLRPPASGKFLRLTGFASAAAEHYVVDALAAKLLLYGSQGELQRERVMSHVYADSEVEIDRDGNLFIKRRGQGIKAYTPDGRLLFHPKSDRPILFVQKHRLEVDTQTPRQLRFTDTHAVSVVDKGILVFDKIRLPPQS